MKPVPECLQSALEVRRAPLEAIVLRLKDHFPTAVIQPFFNRPCPLVGGKIPIDLARDQEWHRLCDMVDLLDSAEDLIDRAGGRIHPEAQQALRSVFNVVKRGPAA